MFRETISTFAPAPAKMALTATLSCGATLVDVFADLLNPIRNKQRNDDADGHESGS